MNKYCPTCGEENLEESLFCGKCGTKILEESPISNTTAQYNQQSQAYTPAKSSKKIKPLIAIAAVVALVVVAAIFLVPTINNSNTEINKIPVAGGPKVSFQSLVSGGNAITLPDVGKTAVYGYYIGNDKMGSASYKTVGEEYYQGILCLKTTVDASFEIETYGMKMSVGLTGSAYVSKSDLSLIEYDLDMSIDSGIISDINMDLTITVDKETGEITTTVYSALTGSVSTTLKMNNEFWENPDINYDDLYVGYSREIPYTITTSGVDTSGFMTINVTGQEDVVVAKGTYEDCYIVEIYQDTGTSTATQKMWLDENGVCPKIETGNSATGITSSMTLELEEYYTT